MTSTQDIITGILQREGGFVDNSADKGGATNLGITQATLSAYRGAQATVEDVQNLTRAEAAAIYTSLYINKPGFNQLEDDSVKAFMVDWAVNSGPSTAIKHLQRLLPPCVCDGVLGPATARLANQCDQSMLLVHLVDLRLEFVKDIVAANPSQAQFLAGWEKRINSFRAA